MKYKNAKVVFPKSLLEEIQKYVQGDLIYIPKSSDRYEKWGTNTETKAVLARRNQEIINAFQAGMSVVELATRYFLAEETIKKIVYCKKLNLA